MRTWLVLIAGPAKQDLQFDSTGHWSIIARILRTNWYLSRCWWVVVRRFWQKSGRMWCWGEERFFAVLRMMVLEEYGNGSVYRLWS
jgi:hypothetical protein